jgi:hypothetical protein
MELTSVKDDADQSRRIDKYGPATLLAGRQLHAGRSVFFFNMTGGWRRSKRRDDCSRKAKPRRNAWRRAAASRVRIRCVGHL